MNADILAIAHEVFAHEISTNSHGSLSGQESLLYWGTAMSIRALRDAGKLKPDCSILVVGAGLEPVSFYLTNCVKQVFAVDLYLSEKILNPQFSHSMLLRIPEVAPYPCNLHRLVVQHMDERILQFADETFDGIIVLDTLQRAADLRAVAAASYELGRVLKDGGIVAFNTQYCLAGPPGLVNCAGMLLPSIRDVDRFVVQASGLEPIDTIHTTISEPTLTLQRDLQQFAIVKQEVALETAMYVGTSRYWSKQPYLVHTHQGFVFSSLHLALQKTDRHANSQNEWARLTSSDLNEIVQTNQAIAFSSKQAPVVAVDTAIVSETKMDSGINRIHQLEADYQQWNAARLRGWYNKWIRRLPNQIGSLIRSFIRIATLGQVHQTQAVLSHSLIEQQSYLETKIVQLHDRNAELVRLLQQLQTQLTQQSEHQRNEQQQLQTQLAQQSEHQRNEQQRLQTQLVSKVETLGLQFSELTNKLQLQSNQVHQLSDTLILASSQHDQVDQVARQALSYARLAIYQNAIAQDKLDSQSVLKLNSVQAVEIVQSIDQHVKGLAQCHAVEVSVQGEDAETIVVAIANYFGDRMSSHEHEYRHPNDAWIHIDGSDQWNRPNLFEDATSRLRLGGLYILITLAIHDITVIPPGIELIEELSFTDNPLPLKAFVFRNI